MIENIVIFGATSAIATALARRLTHAQAHFVLVGRDQARLDAVAADLASRGAVSVQSLVADFQCETSMRAACTAARSGLSSVDLVVVAHGALPDQRACELGPSSLAQVYAINVVSYAAVMVTMAEILREQGAGTIVVLGSVAGDRGKASNYLYGAAKASVAVLQQGLMARLHGSGAHALLVKLGFVDTPMTAEYRKGMLWASPDAVAAAIIAGVVARRYTIYVPWFWRWIMLSLKMLPDRIFVRMGL